MPIEPFNIPLNNNNPSKEILASSGIYNQQRYAPQPYADDTGSSLISNTGIQTTTTTTTKNPDNPDAYDPRSQHAFFIALNNVPAPQNRAMLNDGNYFIDDMLVFNKYISYDTRKLVTFDPQSFLEESIVNFNIYSLEYR